MAFPTNKFSLVAGATFSSGDLYKGVEVNSSGHAVIGNTTDNSNLIVGTLYSFTATTSAAGVESVTIGHGPSVKVRMAASTRAAGQTVAFSSAGLGIAPTTDSTAWGVASAGSSGSTGRIFDVIRTNG